MSSDTKNISKQTKPSFIRIEVDDLVGYFISYWNLAIKKYLKDYYCTFNLENYPPVKLPLNSFNLNLINNNSLTENEKPLLFEEKLFTIKIHFLSSEKELNSEFFQDVKQNYDNKNLNLVLITMNEIKEDANILKDCTKIINKIKSKTGLNDLIFLPYNIIYFEQLQSGFPPFLEFFTQKFTKEFLNKFETLTKKFEKYEASEANTDASKKVDYENYQYLQELICYFDLLSHVEYWGIIQKYCKKYLFRDLPCLISEYNIMKTSTFSEYDVNKFKLIYKTKKLTNIEFQEYILYYYIKTYQYLKEYANIFNFIQLIPYKLNLLIKNFKTEYHSIHWALNYFYYLINYFTSLVKSLPSPHDKKVNEGLIILYSLCIKFLNLYAYKSNNIYIPNNKILIELIECLKNNNHSKIEEQMKNFINKKKEVDNKDLTLFINDIKDINDKICMILNDNNKFLEELLSLLNNINKKNKENINFDISIRCIFDIVYLLIFFCKFKEVKDMLVPLLQYKFLKEQKIKYFYEYICFILLLVLSFIDKNYDNLNLVFKLINIKYSISNKLLQNLNCDNKNMIYTIISNYLESFNPNGTDKKDEICFPLDGALDITLFGGENKSLFINKLKNQVQKIDYKITNNTGIELNINKINLIFEEIEVNNVNNSVNNKKNVIYVINKDKNSLKKLMSFIKEKDEYFEIEYRDIFKINNIYKLVEIQYEMNNSIKGIYHIKQKIELLLSDLNINIKTEMHSSYDNPNANNKFYYNILSMIKIYISNISDISELKNKSLVIKLIDVGNNSDSILKIQTELLKSALKQKIPDIIVNDLSIEFPPNSVKDIKDINNLNIPFFIENINYYSDKNNKIEIIINIKENDNILFSYSSIYKIEYTHLFTIGKRFKILNNNSYLFQTFLSLNVETTKVKVYNLNNITNIDAKQAINKILLLNDNENDILLKLRNNFIIFTLNNEDDIKYRFCLPEKNILDEILEIKEIPYHISINIENEDKHQQFDLLNEININICVKKYKEKKVKLMVKINDNDNWSVVGKNKIIEEFGSDKGEKNIKIILLPLVDGFLQLPEIEFSEYEIDSDSNLNLKKEDKKGNNDENIVEFEPIEFGTVIEGEKNVLKISPLKEYNLKINLT